MHRAVKLQHVFAACRLVQAVDVLGDDGGELSRLLQLRQLFVGGVGLHVQKQHLLLVKRVKIRGFFHKKVVAENGLRGIFPGLAVKAVPAAEIRHAGFCAHSRAAEKDDAPRPVDIVLQGLQFVHASLSFFKKPAAREAFSTPAAAAPVISPDTTAAASSNGR